MKETQLHFNFVFNCRQLIDKNNAKFPLYLPENSDGFCLLFDDISIGLLKQVIDYAVLEIIENLHTQHIKIHVFDFNSKPKFTYLSQLKSAGIYSISNSAKQALHNFNNFNKELRKCRYFDARGATALICQ